MKNATTEKNKSQTQGPMRCTKEKYITDQMDKKGKKNIHKVILHFCTVHKLTQNCWMSVQKCKIKPVFDFFVSQFCMDRLPNETFLDSNHSLKKLISKWFYFALLHCRNITSKAE
jgi:hypothetical protein